MNKNLKKVLRSLLLLVFLGVGVYILLPQFGSIQRSMYVLKNLKYWALFLAILCEFCSYVGAGYLVNSILGLFNERISLWRCVVIVLASSSVGMVAGGMLGSAAASFQWIRNSKAKTQAAALASSLPLLMNNLAILIISLFGVIYLLFLHELTNLQIISFLFILLLLLAVVLAIFLVLYKREKSFPFLLKIMKKVYGFIKRSFNEERIKGQLNEIFAAWDLLLSKGWKKPVLGVLVSYGFDILALFFLFAAGNKWINLGVLLMGYGLPLLLGKATFVIPGGVGVVETTMVALYEKLGMTNAVSVVAVLAYRLIAFWIPSILGFPFTFYLNHKTKELSS
ncbi:MAG TPA: YbhN family protein [Anaerolineaceae bacterium]|nr:YbhN family protein [Anaerolineaceae bacterium]